MFRFFRILLVCILASSFEVAVPADGQTISDQKEAVAFLFGVTHPRNVDGSPARDARGGPLSIEAPLGTAFFASYPDQLGGPDFGFCYLVTAKHVLRDYDGSFLRTVKLRLNVKSDKQKGVEFLDIPVSDESGKLLWLHDDEDAADEAVAIPLLPDVKAFEFKAIPLSMFMDAAMLKSERVAEGDALYFIGLMAQFYGAERNYPVIRRGTLALVTDEAIETPWGPENALIAELSSWPGNSGSPVFINLSGFRDAGTILAPPNVHFTGILLGSFLNKLKAATVDSTTVISGNELNTGISFILPASRLRQMLESSAARQLRDQELRRNPAPR